MHLISAFLCVVSLCGAPTALFAATNAGDPLLRVMIDAGHGGVDAGAVVGVARESEIALKVAKALERRLKSDSRFVALMTRDRDQMLSLSERVRRADAAEADLFLSIHANSSPDQRARGVEFYFQNQLPPDEESLFLAASENKMEKVVEAAHATDDLKKESDVRSIVEDLKRQVRLQKSFLLSRTLARTWQKAEKIDAGSIRQAPFFVIAKSARPAVLVELGFLTNPIEAQKLMKSATQEQIAARIHQGLVEYLGRHQTKFPLN